MMKIVTTAVAALVLAACAATPTESANTPPAAAPAQELSVQVREVTSPGGITAWLVRDPSIPVTAMRFRFRGAGAELDQPGRRGTANLMSALLDEGAGDLDSQEFQGRLEAKSITLRFRAGLDAFSGTFYSLNRYRDDAVELLRLAMTEPRFDAEPVERIRNQILIGLKRAETDPDSIADRALWSGLFPDHSYGQPVRGTAESVAAIQAADMRDHLARGLTRDRLTVGVVGDITPEALGLLLDHVFGGLPASGEISPADPVEPEAGALRTVEMDVPQTVISFAQPGIRRDDPDFYAAYVLNHILGGGGFTSRLTEEIREKRGLAYSVYSHLYSLDDASLVFGGAATQNERAGETLSLLRSEWDRLASQGVGAAELADAKTYLTGAYPLRFTSSGGIAAMLVGIQEDGLGIDYFSRRNSYIDAVTLDQVNSVARRLLRPDKLTIIAVGRPAGIDNNN